MIGGVNPERGDVIRGRWYRGEYRVMAPLGSGGTAKVYLVKDLSTGKEYALKLSADLAGMDREYRTLSALWRLDYVPRVYQRDDCKIRGENRYFLVMDYLKGENLKRVYKGKRTPPETAAKIAALTAMICLRLNRCGVYYCDIKPENLIFDRKTGSVCLVDFGGVTGKGGAVTQYTPAFDRASWGRGERVADEGYQGFAILMMFTDMVLGGVRDTAMGFDALLAGINKSQLSIKLKKVIIEGLKKDCQSLEGLLADLKRAGFYAPGGEQCSQRGTDALINIGLLASMAVFIVVLTIIL